MSRHVHGVARALVGILVSIAGCASGNPSGTPDGGGLFRCDEDSDCNDMTDCTVDSCAVGGSCSFMPVDALCEAGQTCVAGRGCITGSCDDNADCDDAIDCTIDSCGVGGMCRHMPLNDLCSDPGAPMCDPVMGCVRGTGCTTAADCDDAIDCTIDSCGADMTCRHTAVHSECAAGQMCSPSMGCYTPMPCTVPADCDDSNFCNGVEQCVPEFGCAPAAAPRMCDDSDDCTVDSCDATSDMCVFRCDPTRGAACMAMCPPPAAGCNGRFTVTGTTTFGCSTVGVSVDMSEATFENADGILTVESRGFMTTPPVAGGLVFTDMTEPVCPMFDATVVVPGSGSGGCDEHYRIRGTFTDDDHFTGTVEWSYVGELCDLLCPAGSGSVSGTRAP